jgi:hypothetical protein
MSLSHDDVINSWFADAIEYAKSVGVPLTHLRELIVEMTTPCPPFEMFDSEGELFGTFQTEESVRAHMDADHYAVDAVGNTLGFVDEEVGEWQIKGKDFT